MNNLLMNNLLIYLYIFNYILIIFIVSCKFGRIDKKYL